MTPGASLIPRRRPQGIVRIVVTAFAEARDSLAARLSHHPVVMRVASMDADGLGIPGESARRLPAGPRKDAHRPTTAPRAARALVILGPMS